MAKNFYPDQYRSDAVHRINHNYLHEQFADHEVILEKIAAVVREGDFTLGRAVDQFERSFLGVTGGRHAIGVGSGTDALFLSLKALNLASGDEVITAPFTFYATIGAIVTAGGRPVFVDIGEDHNIDPEAIERAITPRTRVIMPIHWAGVPCAMDKINDIAKRHGLKVVADSCHAIGAAIDGRKIAEWADISCFSMHPLKNLNVWGDGGVVVTNDDDVAARLVSIRNHGLADRDTCIEWAYNSRLDTIQAVVAQHVLDHKLANITERRHANAQKLDAALAGRSGARLPPRDPRNYSVFHLYMARFERRDALKEALQARGIDAKVHYPTPMHLQPAAKGWGYKPGDFPNAESLAANCMSLPVHEFITERDIETMIAAIEECAP